MHYNFMHKYGIAEQATDSTDTVKIAELQSRTMKQLQHNDDSLNIILSKYSLTLKNPEVLSYALAWYGFWLHMSDKAVQEAKPRLAKATYSPLAMSIVEAITSAPPQNTSADFMGKDYPLISGGTIRLSNISSDYILLDFWASWCVPCRKGIKTTIKYLEEKYNEKRLTIIGIALEAEKEKALQAVQKDKNNAVQIYDGLQPELKRIFEVVDIPYYILINTRTGTIKRIWIAESIDEIISAGK
jgi:thiol-disulfide isomerase/thioredoxin